MQKTLNPCIKTSDFAKICGTSKRTLIHYDAIGLFHPAFTDENGYRYYSESQCDVFFTIRCLKDLGMPLQEIKAFIDDRNPESLDSLLEKQMKEAEKTLAWFRRIRQVIAAKREMIQLGKGITFQGRLSEIFMESQPDEYYLATRRLDTDEHATLFHALTEHITESYARQLNFGHPYGAVLSVQDLREERFDRYAYFITKIDRSCVESAAALESAAAFESVAAPEPLVAAESASASEPVPSFLRKPAGQYLTMYLKGDYYDADEALRTFLAYIDAHQIQTGDYIYKEAVWDELTVMDMKDYITKISVGCERSLNI